MEPEEFAQEFVSLYRELYRLAVRRVANARDVMTPEITALLLHLSQTGPLTLSELAQHFDRAPSTLSVKVSELESQGLLARQKDHSDARRALIWLSADGRQALLRALEVLDSELLAQGARRLSAEQCHELLNGLRALIAALPPTRRNP